MVPGRTSADSNIAPAATACAEFVKMQEAKENALMPLEWRSGCSRGIKVALRPSCRASLPFERPLALSTWI